MNEILDPSRPMSVAEYCTLIDAGDITLDDACEHLRQSGGWLPTTQYVPDEGVLLECFVVGVGPPENQFYGKFEYYGQQENGMWFRRADCNHKCFVWVGSPTHFRQVTPTEAA